MTTFRRLAVLACLAGTLTAPAYATESGLFVDLNKAETTAAGCRLTYVVNNQTGHTLSGKSVVISVFDANGTFSRKVVFRFGGIAAAKTKVQQFDLVGSACEDISKLLIDEITECVTDDGTELDCTGALVTTSDTGIELAY